MKRFSTFAAPQEAALTKIGDRGPSQALNFQLIPTVIDASSVANGDEAVIAILPEGARIIPALSRITGKDGSAITGTLGFEAVENGTPQDDGFGIAVQTRQDEGGGLSFSESATNAPLEKQSYVYVKATAAGTAGTGDGNVLVNLAYTLLT